jgi:predicted Zn-dependent protease
MKMNKTNFDDYLNESLTQLDKNIPPKKELWNGIERAIIANNQPTINTNQYWAKLTAIAACFTAVLVSTVLLFKVPEANTAVAMSEFFTKQKQSLLVQYQSQAALTDNWQVQLQELEDAEQAIKQTLENEPKNKALLSMLAQVYQQQLDLINKVHAPRWQHI